MDADITRAMIKKNEKQVWTWSSGLIFFFVSLCILRRSHVKRLLAFQPSREGSPAPCTALSVDICFIRSRLSSRMTSQRSPVLAPAPSPPSSYQSGDGQNTVLNAELLLPVLCTLFGALLFVRLELGTSISGLARF